jgi:hypothetical protein
LNRTIETRKIRKKAPSGPKDLKEKCISRSIREKPTESARATAVIISFPPLPSNLLLKVTFATPRKRRKAMVKSIVEEYRS